MTGHRLSETNDTWDSVAERTIRLYHWLAGQGPQPVEVFAA